MGVWQPLDRQVPALDTAPDVDPTADDPFPRIDVSPVYFVPGGAVFHADRHCQGLQATRRRSAGATAFLPERDQDWGPCPHCVGVVGGAGGD